ncbi:MAG: hypothetical protein WBP45_00130, partial [Daejeonella sp.]
MRKKILIFILLIKAVTACYSSFAQVKPVVKRGAELDSLRKKEDNNQDSITFTSKFIRFTTAGYLKDSTQTLPIDTSLKNFHNYNPLYQPLRPTIGLG